MNIKETKERHARWRRGVGFVLIVIGALVLVRTIFAFLENRPVELRQTFVGEDYDSLMLLITSVPLVGGALLLPDIDIDEGNRRASVARVSLMSVLFDSIGIVAVAIGYFVMPKKRGV